MGRKEKFDNDEFKELKDQIYQDNDYFKNNENDEPISSQDKKLLELLKSGKKLRLN